MDEVWKQALRSQFIASIQMLDLTIQDCPDELWQSKLWDDPHAPPGFSDFWYVAYHALFWFDCYLYGVVEGFMPPAPFDLNEFDADGLLPAHKPNKSELLDYLAYCRNKCVSSLDTLTDEKAQEDCKFPWSKGNLSYVELQLDNMRHVQEHGAQLRMFLGQQRQINARWVART